MFIAVINKSDGKCRNTLRCLDQYTCNMLRLWNSRDCETVYVFMAHWWTCISSSGETRKFDFLSQIWPWRSRSIATQNKRDHNQAILVILAGMGDAL